MGNCKDCKRKVNTVNDKNKKLKLGGWSFEQELLDYLLKELPPQSYPRILEFGSGVGTQFLTNEGYKVTSIEHDIKFIGKYENERYIHAPIVNGWYDMEVIKPILANLDNNFDIVLIDGPPGEIGRYKIIEHWFLLGIMNSVIIIDDTNRPAEMKLANDLCELLKSIPFHHKTFSVLF